MITMSRIRNEKNEWFNFQEKGMYKN